MSNNRLGKGLGALLGADALEEKRGDTNIADELVVEIMTYKIDPNPDQPRREFDEDALLELAESIQSVGILQPILVTPGLSGRYTIVAGERRWRAAKIASLATIPAIVRTYDDRAHQEVALIENLQREDLNAMEESSAIAQLIDTYALTQEEVANRIGKSRSAVANSVRLLALPQQIQLFIREGKLSAGHARAILKVEGSENQMALAEEIIEKKLSVREAEKLAATLTDTGSTKRARQKKSDRDVHIVRAEDAMRSALGTRVSIMGSPKKGRITIDYFSQEDLDRIYEAIVPEE